MAVFLSLLVAILAACAPGAATPSLTDTLPPTTAPTATPRPPLEQHLRQAFQEPDLFQRRQRVLDATDNFLRDTSIQTTEDVVAASYYSDIAFSSGRLTLPYPVSIQRQGDTAVIALPEGLGLYLYDLRQPAGTPPVRVSDWAVGVVALEVQWHDNAAGIIFLTEGEQDTRVHYALAVDRDGTWQIAWFSDETPDWWFNAVGGTLAVEEDLSMLTLTGSAGRTTDVFLDNADQIQRRFAVRWVRDNNRYTVDPPMEDFPSRRAWLWRVARPSAYATLVEFIERLQYDEADGLQRLMVTADVLETANTFGLGRGERRYQIVSADADQITFRDLQGTFIATFEPPTAPDQPWRIRSIALPGATEPTDTPDS